MCLLLAGKDKKRTFFLFLVVFCMTATSHILDYAAPVHKARFYDLVSGSSDNSSLGGRRLRAERVLVFQWRLVGGQIVRWWNPPVGKALGER